MTDEATGGNKTGRKLITRLNLEPGFGLRGSSDFPLP